MKDTDQTGQGPRHDQAQRADWIDGGAVRPGFMFKGRWVPVFAGGDDDPPADPPTDPPSGNPPSDPPADPPAGGGETEAELKARLQKVSQEAAANRVRAKEAEDKLKKYEDSQKSEADKLRETAENEKRAREATESRLKAILMDRAIESQATKMGAVDPEAVAALIDRNGIEVDDEGRPDPDQVKAKVEALLKDKPYLVGKAGSPGNPGRQPGDLTIDDVKKLTPDQIAALPDEEYQKVQKVLAAAR